MRLSTSISAGRARRPADPFAGEAVGLGEGAGDEDVGVPGGQREPAVVLARRNVFGIGLVEHQQHGAGKRRMQPGKLGTRQEAARGIVRVGEKDHAGPVADPREQRVDVGAVIVVGGDHGDGAAAAGGDLVQREAVADIENLVAGTGERARRERQQLAGTRTADDPRGVDPVQPAECIAQRGAVGSG
jgi:hypothetical protein